MMPTFFTRLGATAFVASQIAKTLTATFFFLIVWDFIQVPELGWIRGYERSSPILLSALAAMVTAMLAVMGSVARPTGPGTGKWWANDMVYTFLLGFVLVIGLFGWNLYNWDKTTIQLTGIKLDLAILVGALFVIQFVASLIADSIQDMMGPSTRTPPMPAPAISNFRANQPSVVAGGSVILEWTTAYAAEAEINGVGTVPLNGPLSVRPAGAAGTTATYTLTVRGPGGTQTASVTVNIT
jgi:hypothetical protein